MTDPTAEVKQYLAKIGRKGGKQPSPHKKYNSDAERQKAYRKRKKQEVNNERETTTHIGGE